MLFGDTALLLTGIKYIGLPWFCEEKISFFLSLSSLSLLGMWFILPLNGDSDGQKFVLRVVWQAVVHFQTWG